MSATTEQIKERLGIVEVVSGYIKLEKSGSNFKAKCPFHHEKTPSFFVSPSRNTYYCFGCGEKGDIFSFVEGFEGVEFKDALKILAEKAGVEIVYETDERKKDRIALQDILEETTQYFERNLEGNRDALKYLSDRGLTEKTISRFRLGYIPDHWNDLYDFLKERGYKDEDILKAGLIKKGEKGFYDTFRSRIIFPIADSQGKVIAYTGRIFPHQEDIAKYLNSPETELFNKSRILYGFHLAKIPMRKANFSIVVEGQMDVVMAQQSGFPNTVALSGTALSEHHVKALKQLSNNIVFAFDSDKAGINSSGRSAEMALGAGMDVKVARLPDGKDPADLALEDPELLKKAVRESVHIIEFYMDVITASESDRRKLNRKVEETVLPFVARIPSKIDQMHFVTEIARRLGLPEETIRDEVIAKSKTIERSPAVVEEKKTKVENETLTREDVIKNKLFGILFSQKEVSDTPIDVANLEKKLKEIVGKDEFESIIKHPEKFEQETLFLIEVGYNDEKQMVSDVEVLLKELEKEIVKEKYDEALAKLREAESRGDQKEIESLLKECKEIGERLDALKQ